MVETNYTMLCDSNGDLWKRFPDGSVCPIEDEDDLRDAKKIDALTPSPDSLRRFLSATDAEVIAWVPCRNCHGTGTFTGLCIYVREWDEDHGWISTPVRPYDFKDKKANEFTDQGSCPCPDCKGSGRTHCWTGERVLVEAMA